MPVLTDENDLPSRSRPVVEGRNSVLCSAIGVSRFDMTSAPSPHLFLLFRAVPAHETTLTWQSTLDTGRGACEITSHVVFELRRRKGLLFLNSWRRRLHAQSANGTLACSIVIVSVGYFGRVCLKVISRIRML